MTRLTEITVDVSEGVALLTLDRPEKLNAYTPVMGDELVSCLRDLQSDESVRSVVLTGNGRAFCAGADLEYLKGKRTPEGLRIGEESFITEYASELAYYRKPLVAAVNGVAVGIGVTMLLPFDMRICSREAGFSFPFVKYGIVPGLGCGYFLPRLVGGAVAKELILTGAQVDAGQALTIGLVNEVTEPHELLPRAMEIARQTARYDPDVVAACKRIFNVGINASLPEAMAVERQEADRISLPGAVSH